MISELTIDRFRGIRQGHLTLDRLTVIVGPNGAGKSSILEAILIATGAPNEKRLREVILRHADLHSAARWLAWGGRGGEATIRATAGKKTDAERERTWRLRTSGYDSTTVLDCAVSEKRANAADVGEKFTVKVDTMGNVMPGQLGQGFDDLKFPIGLDGKALAEAHLVEPTFQAQQQPLHTLYSESVKAGHRKDLQTLVSAVIPGADNVEILTEGDTPVLHVDFRNGSVPATLCGDGIRAVLRLTMELSINPGGVALLEEPEIHQHPALIRQSARAIVAAVKHGVQVVMTTHSLELIDALVAEADDDVLNRMGIHRVKIDDGKLVTSRVPGPDAALARVQIEEDLR